MAAETPAGGVAFAGHLHGAEPDLLHGADIPTAMMQAGAAGARERDQVMVAAMRAVHEGDIAFRRVGEAQAQHIAVKADRGRRRRCRAQDGRAGADASVVRRVDSSCLARPPVRSKR